MELNKRFLSVLSIIFIFRLFLFSNCFAQDLIFNEQKNSDSFSHGFQVYFFVDNKSETIPPSVREDVKSMGVTEFDQAMILALMKTDLYQDVSVDQIESAQGELAFVVKSNSIKRVQSIEFYGLNSQDQTNFTRFLSMQTASVYNPILLKEDVNRLQNDMRARGYPNAKVVRYQVNSIGDHFVKIIYEIEKGTPCHIEKITVKNQRFNFTDFLTGPIEVGSLCDIPAVKDNLESIKEKFVTEGYLNPHVELDDVIYSEGKESAEVVLLIDKGTKTSIQVRDEKDEFLDFNFFSDSKAGLSYADLSSLSDSDLKNLVTDFYRKQGYAFARVLAFERVKADSGNTILKFKVDKGRAFKIGDVHFSGKFPKSKSEMREDMGLKASFFQFKGIPFVESMLEEYRDKLKNIFISSGYLDASVSTPDFVYPQEGNAVELYFSAEQGDRYVVSQIDVQGKPDPFLLNQEKLDGIFKSGQTLSFDKKQEYEEEYRNQLLSQGYLYAQVKIDSLVLEDMDEEQVRYVHWKVRVNAGPVVHIRNVYAQGDLFGKEHTIIAISDLRKGDLFTQKHLDMARLQILRHDVFSSVAIEPLDPSAWNRRDSELDVIIRTKARGGFGLSVMPGYGTLRGYKLNSDFTLNKLNRDGLRLISGAGLSQELQQQSFATTDTQQILGQQFTLGFTESLFKLWGLETPFDVSAIAGYQVAAETLTNRKYQTLKLVSEWKPTFFDSFWTFTSTLMHESSIATSSESAVVQTIDSPSIRVREFLNGVSVDTRNNTGWPTSGGYYSFQFGVARFGMGSDVQYNRYLSNIDYFFPIYKKLSGAISFGGTFVEDTITKSGTTVAPPASRRATLTDEALIRGFPETYGSAAPGPLLWIHYANNGVPNCNTQLASTGGTKMVYLKSEARYRINETFGAVLFLDSGESYFSQGEVNQVNNQIAQQIASSSSSSAQCVVDNASLISPSSLVPGDRDLLSQYWQQAYVSTGVGLRLILGNYATVNLDYGYPLKDPTSSLSNCVSPSEAQNSSTPPACITRIQDSTMLWGKLNFQGAIHFGIGAKF